MPASVHQAGGMRDTLGMRSRIHITTAVLRDALERGITLQERAEVLLLIIGPLLMWLVQYLLPQDVKPPALVLPTIGFFASLAFLFFLTAYRYKAKELTREDLLSLSSQLKEFIFESPLIKKSIVSSSKPLFSTSSSDLSEMLSSGGEIGTTLEKWMVDSMKWVDANLPENAFRFAETSTWEEAEAIRDTWGKEGDLQGSRRTYLKLIDIHLGKLQAVAKILEQKIERMDSS